MKKILSYVQLYRSDRAAFYFQLWMVYNRYRIGTVKLFFTLIYRIQRSFITIHHRPQRAADVGIWSEALHNEPKTAIILQGPLVTDYDFTLETIRLYKKNFTGSLFIVSTWKDADARTVAALQAEGATVILNEPPTVSGIGNINFMLVSTMAGLKAARELGAEYVYKTRCDYRMYAVNLSEFLRNMLQAFPVVTGYQQKYRIIATSFPSLKWVPYLIADTMLFGHIDDMLLYWSTPHDPRTKPEKMIRTVEDLMNARMNESYICTEYLKKIGRPVNWTLADSWDAFADHFCIVDKETLDLYWYKYEFYSEYRTKRYEGIANDQILTFLEWFNLYQNRHNKRTIPQNTISLARQDYIPNPTQL